MGATMKFWVRGHVQYSHGLQEILILILMFSNIVKTNVIFSAIGQHWISISIFALKAFFVMHVHLNYLM